MPACSLTCRLSAPYGAPALSLGGAFGSRPAPVKRAARCFVESSRLAPRCLASSYSHSCSVVITYMVPHRPTPWMRNQRFCITAGGWCRAGEGPCTCPEAGRDSFAGRARPSVAARCRLSLRARGGVQGRPGSSVRPAFEHLDWPGRPRWWLLLRQKEAELTAKVLQGLCGVLKLALRLLHLLEPDRRDLAFCQWLGDGERLVVFLGRKETVLCRSQLLFFIWGQFAHHRSLPSEPRRQTSATAKFSARHICLPVVGQQSFFCTRRPRQHVSVSGPAPRDYRSRPGGQGALTKPLALALPFSLALAPARVLVPARAPVPARVPFRVRVPSPSP